MLADALFTAQGKVGSDLKVIMIGTLAPMALSAGHWWYDLVTTGSTSTVYVDYYAGNLATWDSWPTIRRANPLWNVDDNFRQTLIAERDGAREDSRLKARYLSFRLNIPTQDESTMLLTVDDWQKVLGRECPPREGTPWVAVDLGGGRAWSAAVAMYPNGRVEARAVAPGVPDLAAQEKRDRVPANTYGRLYDLGQLDVAEGLQVQPPSQLWDLIRDTWGRPKVLICDRFRLKELEDCAKNVRLEARVTQWSEAAYDIRGLRKLCKDGPLAVQEDSVALVETSLSRSMVEGDKAGNVRLVKRGSHNQSRDDVAAALTLVAGLYARQPAKKSGVYLGLVG